MMKRTLTLGLVFVLMLSMTAGCSKKGKKTESASDKGYQIGTNKADLGFEPGDYVTLGDYKGLSSYDISYTASEEEIQEKIDEIKEDNATYTDITDRGAENGDIVTFDYSAKVGDKDVADCAEEGYEIELGNEEFNKEMEEQFIGKKASESFDVTVSMPEDLNEEYAGQEAVFHITIDSLQTKELPEITDKFVKANTDYDSVDAFQKGMKKEVINDKKSDNMDLISQDLITAAVEKATFKDDYPQDLYDKAKSDIDASLDSSAESFSMERKDFLEMFYGMTEEDLKEDYLNETHSRLVLYAIAQKESLFPTKKQYQSYLEDLVDEYDYESAEALEEEAGKDEIMYQAVYDNVAAFLFDQAKKEKITSDEYENLQEGTDGEEDTDETEDTTEETAE